MNTDDNTTTPVSITPPCGEVIELNAVPYGGWGNEPGKAYTIIKRDDDGNELWRHWWAISPLIPLVRPANGDIR